MKVSGAIEHKRVESITKWNPRNEKWTAEIKTQIRHIRTKETIENEAQTVNRMEISLTKVWCKEVKVWKNS